MYIMSYVDNDDWHKSATISDLKPDIFAYLYTKGCADYDNRTYKVSEQELNKIYKPDVVNNVIRMMENVDAVSEGNAPNRIWSRALAGGKRHMKASRMFEFRRSGKARRTRRTRRTRRSRRAVKLRGTRKY